MQKKSRNLLVAIIIVLVIVVAGGAFYMYEMVAKYQIATITGSSSAAGCTLTIGVGGTLPATAATKWVGKKIYVDSPTAGVSAKGTIASVTAVSGANIIVLNPVAVNTCPTTSPSALTTADVVKVYKM